MSVYNSILQQIEDAYQARCRTRNSINCKYLFDAILYINLDHRTDRLALLQPTLQLLEPFAQQTIRVSAIQHAQGGKGCALSHLKVFGLIQKHQFVHTLVLEDDATLDEEPSVFASKIKTFLREKAEQYDCLILGAHPAPFENKVKNASYRRMTKEFREPTVGYMIHIDYVPILRMLWQFCVDGLDDKKMAVPGSDKNYALYAIDQAWRKLFEKHQFYWLEDNVVRQFCSQSDITREIHRSYPPYKLSVERRRELQLPLDPNKVHHKETV